MIDRKTLTPDTLIEVRNPHNRVSYGPGGRGAFKVVKVGRVNVRASSRVRFSPTGPWYEHEHTIPLSHVVRVIPRPRVTLEPIGGSERYTIVLHDETPEAWIGVHVGAPHLEPSTFPKYAWKLVPQD